MKRDIIYIILILLIFGKKKQIFKVYSWKVKEKKEERTEWKIKPTIKQQQKQQQRKFKTITIYYVIHIYSLIDI